MRAGLLPKGYERLDCEGLDDLTGTYYSGKCTVDDVHNLLLQSDTWRYDQSLNELAQQKKRLGLPVETPEGDRLMFAFYFFTPDDDTIVMTFPDKRTKEHVRAYVKIRPRPDMDVDDAVYASIKEKIFEDCQRRGRSIARLLEGTIRDYHEERG
jgi:hypothetical protein